MDWIQSQWSDTGTDEKTIAITTYLKPTTDMTAKNRSRLVTTKTEVDSENPLALLVTTSMVEMHISGTGTKWERTQPEEVIRKARPDRERWTIPSDKGVCSQLSFSELPGEFLVVQVSKAPPHTYLLSSS